MMRVIMQLVSKPEMTFDEMVTFILDHFPFFGESESVLGISDPNDGTVRFLLKQERLTTVQRDWLHCSGFSARYIDYYKLEYGQEPSDESGGLRNG